MPPHPPASIAWVDPHPRQAQKVSHMKMSQFPFDKLSHIPYNPLAKREGVVDWTNAEKEIISTWF